MRLHDQVGKHDQIAGTGFLYVLSLQGDALHPKMPSANFWLAFPLPPLVNFKALFLHLEMTPIFPACKWESKMEETILVIGAAEHFVLEGGGVILQWQLSYEKNAFTASLSAAILVLHPMKLC